MITTPRLIKIGNIKTGVVNNNLPIALDKMIVTLPSKDDSENFLPHPAFLREGEPQMLDSLTVSLPFNDPKLNFEVSYIGFAEIDNIPYILKSEDIGKPLYAFPLGEQNEDKTVYEVVKKLSEENIGTFGLRLNGLLRVYISGVSSIGEVFFYKTSSINSIKAIQSQLELLHSMTKGHLAYIPLTLKVVSKETDKGTIHYLSIGYGLLKVLDPIDMLEKLETEVSKLVALEGSSISIEAFEKTYKEEREKEVKKAKAMTKKEIEGMIVETSISENKETEEEGVPKTKNKMEEENLLKLLDDNQINYEKLPIPLLVNLYGIMKEKGEDIVGFLKELGDKASVGDIVKKIGSYSQ